MAGEADIFVSYAQGDRDWVKELATALEAEGFSVWWDPNLLPGAKFRDTISKELTAAKAVVVVWSRLSVDSDWVRDEAEDARQLSKLVPTLKDPITPPHGFRQLQTANLSQWRGRREHPEFRGLVEGIRARIASASSGAVGQSSDRLPQGRPASELKPQPSPARDGLARNRNWTILAGGITGLVVAGLIGAAAAGFFAFRPGAPAAKPEVAATSGPGPAQAAMPNASAPPPPAQAATPNVSVVPQPAQAAVPDASALPQGIDLSGVWQTQTGAIFYVRQIGSEIWWYGAQSPTGPGWTNVANGRFDGTYIQVRWVDVPPGPSRHSGTLTLTRVGDRHLIVSQNPDDFLSADWFMK